MNSHPSGHRNGTLTPHAHFRGVTGNQAGISLLTVIGLLAVVTIGLATIPSTFVRIWDREFQEREDSVLANIAQGIPIYLRQNKAFPPSLTALSPDYASLSTGQIATNARGFPRYLVGHPDLSGFQNQAGLQASEIPNTRFLIISDLSQDAAPAIASAADFDAWWTIDESTMPNLKIYRGHWGHLLLSLNLNAEGNGASFSIYNQVTDSNGFLLPTHNRFHLIGTAIGLDEDDVYSTPEIFFGLTANSTYWFDPGCPISKRWNPLDPDCGGWFTVRDELTLIAYDGNNGNQNWSNDWQESGEADGPTAGKMRVLNAVNCVSGNCFRFGGGGGGPATGVSREADLSGATSATLTFTYQRVGTQNGGSIGLEVSNNGGGSWTPVQTYSMNNSDASPIPQSFDLTAYIGANTAIRFQRNGNVSRYFYADNIQIQWN